MKNNQIRVKTVKSIGRTEMVENSKSMDEDSEERSVREGRIPGNVSIVVTGCRGKYRRLGGRGHRALA